MVDTKKIAEDIITSGKKKCYIAEKCGMTIQTLNAKLGNRSEFTTSEVEALCIELGYETAEQVQNVFFLPRK